MLCKEELALARSAIFKLISIVFLGIVAVGYCFGILSRYRKNHENVMFLRVFFLQSLTTKHIISPQICRCTTLFSHNNHFQMFYIQPSTKSSFYVIVARSIVRCVCIYIYTCSNHKYVCFNFSVLFSVIIVTIQFLFRFGSLMFRVVVFVFGFSFVRHLNKIKAKWQKKYDPIPQHKRQ